MTPRIGVKGEQRLEDRGQRLRGGGLERWEEVWSGRESLLSKTFVLRIPREINSRRRYMSMIVEFFLLFLLPSPFHPPPHLRSLISPQTRSLCTRNWHNIASSCFLSNPVVVLWSSFWIKIIYTRLRERWDTLTTFRGFWGGEIGLLEGIWTGDS